MNFQQYLHQLDTNHFLDVMKKRHVKEAEQTLYLRFIEKLKQQKPKESDSTLNCRMEESGDEGILLPVVTVSKDGKEYAIDFIPWEEVLSYQVHPNALEAFSLEAFCYHVLYDMSFDGFDEEERQERFSRIEERLDENRKQDPVSQEWNKRFEKGEIDYEELIDHIRKKRGL